MIRNNRLACALALSALEVLTSCRAPTQRPSTHQSTSGPSSTTQSASVASPRSSSNPCVLSSSEVASVTRLPIAHAHNLKDENEPTSCLYENVSSTGPSIFLSIETGYSTDIARAGFDRTTQGDTPLANIGDEAVAADIPGEDRLGFRKANLIVNLGISYIHLSLPFKTFDHQLIALGKAVASRLTRSPFAMSAPADPGTTSGAKPSSTVTPAVSTTLQSAAPKRGAMSSEAEAELLTVSDLPAGWRPTQSPATSGGPCGGVPPLATIGDSGSADAAFDQLTLFPDLHEHIGVFKESPAVLFTQFVRNLGQCRSFTDSGYTMTLKRLPFPALGSESAAYRATGSLGRLALGYDIVMVAKGNQLAILSYANPRHPDVAPLADIATKAVAKMPA